MLISPYPHLPNLRSFLEGWLSAAAAHSDARHQCCLPACDFRGRQLLEVRKTQFTENSFGSQVLQTEHRTSRHTLPMAKISLNMAHVLQRTLNTLQKSPNTLHTVHKSLKIFHTSQLQEIRGVQLLSMHKLKNPEGESN